MIKLLLFMAFISSAFPREKDPHPFFTETSEPVAELYAAKNDPDHDYFDRLMFLSKRVKATVEGPYVEIQSIYTYKNIMDHLVATEFEFPQIETDISHRVEIRYQDTSRIIFDEANSPMKEYDKENQYTKERFSYKEIRAGNVRAQDTVEVIFTVMRPLKINLNQFYELSINPHYEERFGTLNKELIKRNYNVQVELRSERPFVILTNPTHHLKPEFSKHTDPLSGVPLIYKAFYNATLQGSVFSQDFKIYFASTGFNTPQTIMATHIFNPHDHVFMFSLIPDMKYFDPWSWERRLLHNLSDPDTFSKLKKVIRQSEIQYFPKEYLFVIDRSNSMKGSHIEDLKKTLNEILDNFSRSLSYYSILSFGNSTQLHWKKSKDEKEYDKMPEETAEIMKWIETIEADMGEKDLLGALKYAFEEYKWGPLPKNVIILTDGKVTNTEEIIQLVQANSHAHKICAIGDEKENGDILRKIGAAGGCPIEIPWWSEYFDNRFLEVIDATFTSPAFNLAYEITCENGQNETVHQEEGGFDGIGKDEAFIKWITLKNIPNLKSCKAKIFYYSPQRCSSSYNEVEIFRSEKAQLTDIWHKVADHSKPHDELQIEKSKRKLMVNNNMQEEEPPVVSFEWQEITQEELISQQKRSLYDIYQEQFNNLPCPGPKEGAILSPFGLSKPFFFEPILGENETEGDSSRSEELGKGTFSYRDEELEDESFFSFKIICNAFVFTLLLVAALKIILK